MVLGNEKYSDVILVFFIGSCLAWRCPESGSDSLFAGLLTFATARDASLIQFLL